MTVHGITIDEAGLADLCRRHHIRQLALFGSVLGLDFRPESDVDVLVEFEPGHVPGFGYFGIQEEQSALIGRKVDHFTLAFLSRHFRDEVEAQAEVLYAA